MCQQFIQILTIFLRLFARTLKEIICECNGKPDHIIHGGIATTKEYW